MDTSFAYTFDTFVVFVILLHLMQLSLVVSGYHITCLVFDVHKVV